MSKKYILFGAGEDGRRLLNLLDKEKVDAFVDNDERKVGNVIREIPVYSPEYLLKKAGDCSVILSVSEIYQSDIEKQLQDMNITDYMYPSELLKTIEIASNKKISTLRNCFEGKRCFIIGTGPSLTVEDLNTLEEHKEITFASNKIFKVFKETSWRPQLYCISDVDVLAHYYTTICELDIPYQFMVNMQGTGYEKLDYSLLNGDNKYVFNIFYEKDIDELSGGCKPVFSTMPDKYVVDGGITVTYSMLQWAYFLGFKEVYLLGVDFNYGDLSGNDKDNKDHFCREYIEQGEKVNNPKIKDSLAAYKVVKEFSENHDFNVYNATRGGKLEVFRRVNFDEIFKH